MAKFYANENFRARVVDALKQLGHDVLTSDNDPIALAQRIHGSEGFWRCGLKSVDSSESA